MVCSGRICSTGSGAACLTVNYGEYLTDTVERKLHGKSVGVSTNEDAKL